MSHAKTTGQPKVNPLTAREWMKTLIPYRTSSKTRSWLEFFITFVPFVLLCTAAYFALNVSFILSFPLTVLAAIFLVRLFIIQHDCGHGAFFNNKTLNDWMGRFLGVFTMAPYDVWRRAHNVHHSASGNLDNRGMGDIDTLTVKEYQARSWKGKFKYRLYRHPFVLFVIGPIFIFIFHYRLPIGFMNAGPKYWISSMGTNIAIAAFVFLMIYFIGFVPFLLVYLPIILLAAAMGVWLFYVQHQFETTHWERQDDWNREEAALLGSSHYDLPPVLRWLTGNIGIHHVHHLNSRIPFYRLTEVLRDYPALVNMKRLTFMDSFKCIQLQLWDEAKFKLVSFKEARSA